MIVIAPKKLLKFKGACSEIEEFGPGSQFHPIYPDNNQNAVADSKIKKVIVCAGQVYFDLEEERSKKGYNDVAIIRLESYCPFPFFLLNNEFNRYPNATITWAQEEPKNAGGYYYI